MKKRSRKDKSTNSGHQGRTLIIVRSLHTPVILLLLAGVNPQGDDHGCLQAFTIGYGDWSKFPIIRGPIFGFPL